MSHARSDGWVRDDGASGRQRHAFACPVYGHALPLGLGRNPGPSTGLEGQSVCARLARPCSQSTEPGATPAILDMYNHCNRPMKRHQPPRSRRKRALDPCVGAGFARGGAAANAIYSCALGAQPPVSMNGATSHATPPAPLTTDTWPEGVAASWPQHYQHRKGWGLGTGARVLGCAPHTGQRTLLYGAMAWWAPAARQYCRVSL